MLLKIEVIRIVVVNEGRILESMSGAKATVGRQYNIVTEPYRGVCPLCATRWSYFGAECCRDPSVQKVGAVGGGGGPAGGVKPGNANGVPSKVRARRPQDARLPGGMGSKHMAGELHSCRCSHIARLHLHRHNATQPGRKDLAKV